LQYLGGNRGAFTTIAGHLDPVMRRNASVTLKSSNFSML
jgi:hypothetical protein